MVKVRYVGVSNPKSEFEALRDAHSRLQKMMRRCKPYGPDYLILLAAYTALNTAAQHFTREPHFYHGSHGQP